MSGRGVSFDADTKKLRAKLVSIARDAPAEFGKALKEVGHEVRNASMRLTPVDTGALRASHRVEGPTGTGTMKTIAVTVGGPAAPYAWVVHENLKARHPVGQAKFLETAVQQARPRFNTMLADALKRLAEK